MFGNTNFMKFGNTFGNTVSNSVHFSPSCHPSAHPQIKHVLDQFVVLYASKYDLIFNVLHSFQYKRKRA